MTIPLIDKIKPKNNGQFPVFEDADGYGGYQVRTTHADRDSIPALNRKEGMLVFTQSDGYFWQLGPSLSNGEWFPLPVTGGSGIIFDGDLSGNPIMQFVVGLQGNPVSGEMPTDGYVLTWDETDGYWKPISLKDNPGGGAVTFGGDLSGDGYSQTVTGIQNNPVSPFSPADGDVLIWDAIDGYWVPQPITGGGGGGGLTFAGDLEGNAHSQTVTGLQTHPVAMQTPNNNDVLTWDSADGYWKPEPAQGGGGPGTAPNFQEGAITDNLSMTIGTQNILVPVMLVVLQVTGSGDLFAQSSISYKNVNSAYWGLSYVTGSFTVNGGSPTVGYFEQPTIAGGTVTNSVVTQAVPPLNSVSGPSSDARVISLNDTITSGLSSGDFVGVYMSIGFVADPTFSVTFPGSPTNPSGTISVIELSTGGSAGPAGPPGTAGPAGPPGSLSGGASQALWSPTAYPNNGGAGYGAAIGSTNVLEYNDFGNLTQINSDNATNPNYIVVSNGSNASTNFGVQQGSFANVNQMLSRSDRTVTQIPAPGTYTIWNNPCNLGSMMIIQVLSSGGIEAPSQASWVFILDAGAAGSPTTLFTYNPFSITAPTFSSIGSAGIQINITSGNFWTVVALVCAMGIGGTI